MTENNIGLKIRDIEQTLIQSGFFEAADTGAVCPALGLQQALDSARDSQEKLRSVASFLQDHIVGTSRALESRTKKPEDFDQLRTFLERLLASLKDCRGEKEFVSVHGDTLALFIRTLQDCGSAGRDSPIISTILKNITRRKAMELGQDRFDESLKRLRQTITVAIMAKRYAVYVLAVRGIEVLFRTEIPFRAFGTSPEGLALQIANLLMKSDVKLADVTDIVCAGGDLGTLPDGIYVLTERIRDESWKRLHNSSLNRGPLVAWELREILRKQSDKGQIHASLCSPLSFSTLGSHDLTFFYSANSEQLKQSLKGHVRVTPLKSMAALLSELEGTNQQNLNLLVMTLDELFASVARKIGPRIVREMAAQDANRILIDFDFGKIVKAIENENFVIPPQFRLASREIGTGVREICELLMIVDSGRISPSLTRNILHVVDSYCRKVDMVLEMASSGAPEQRPHYIVITSMLANEPYFRSLFERIRRMIDNPLIPLLCLDSLEHEYLVADHLFELYVNPSKGDRRLNFSVEERSMRKALQVLGSSRAGVETFSFPTLLAEVTADIADGTARSANLVIVGADNEDALVAAANAKEQGLLDRVALIGDPTEIIAALERSRVQMSPAMDPKVEIVPIDPLAVEYEAKKTSTAAVFHKFLAENTDFIVMKGSLDTGLLLHQALAIYKTDSAPDATLPVQQKKIASHTALFVLPDGRFFALSDAGVNPGFRNADALTQAIENQLDVVRKAVGPEILLKVAIITAVEKETSAIPSTLLAAEAQTKAKSLQAAYGPLIVEGPLSFDLATVPDVAEEKHYHGEIRGDANCLVATDINTANVLYKMLSKTMGSLGLIVDNGGIITAGPGTVPIVLTSRGDTAQTKLNSILLALAYLARRKGDKAGDAGDSASKKPAVEQ
jgi:phosphotransacetylase